MDTMHHAVHLPVQHVHTIQTSSWTLYSGYAVPSQPHRNMDQKIAGMSIVIHTISTTVDVPVCTSIEDITAAMSKDAELQMYIYTKLKEAIRKR